jgi:hypothetical protein
MKKLMGQEDNMAKVVTLWVVGQHPSGAKGCTPEIQEDDKALKQPTC